MNPFTHHEPHLLLNAMSNTMQRKSGAPQDKMPSLHDIDHNQAFENTSTSVAASQMRNALNNLSDTVTDLQEKKVRRL